MKSAINYPTAKKACEDLILVFGRPFEVKENRFMDLKLAYNTLKHTEHESIFKTFTIYKVLLNELVNDGVTLLIHEINTSFGKSLPKKWLSFYHGLKNSKHFRDPDLATLFGK